MFELNSFVSVICFVALFSMFTLSCSKERAYDLYPITWKSASESDWDIVELIKKIRKEIPEEYQREIASKNSNDLKEGVSFSYEKDITLQEAVKPMSVEYSTMLMDVPFETFQKRLPTAKWGRYLNGLLGGDVKVNKSDEQGRPIRQIERMVFAPIPELLVDTIFNMDMTKVEIIQYDQDRNIVFWNVKFSDNGTTENDIGYVEFRKYSDESTLVTFHSAHRLNWPLIKKPIKHELVRPQLEKIFLGHLKKYLTVVN